MKAAVFVEAGKIQLQERPGDVSIVSTL